MADEWGYVFILIVCNIYYLYCLFLMKPPLLRGERLETMLFFVFVFGPNLIVLRDRLGECWAAYAVLEIEPGWAADKARAWPAVLSPASLSLSCPLLL